MRAAVIKQHGPPHSIIFDHRPIPEPKQTQYLIRVQACGLNHLDTWVRRGVPGHKFPLPMVPGSDVAGIIEKAGDAAKRFTPGDRVLLNPSLSCGYCEACCSGQDHLCPRFGLLGETTDGGCQEYVVVEEAQVFSISEKLSFEQAACIPITFVTAWQMLVGKAKIQPGETILIHAAGSGVSLACLQISQLFGLQIIVTSTSDGKLQKAKQLGAHHLLNSKSTSFRDEVRSIVGKQGVDIVVDHVGETTFMDSIRILRRGGRLVSCGATSGANLNIDWKHVFFKNIALLGSTYGSRGDFFQVLKHFEQGHLAPVIDSIISLDELPKAHAAIESRMTFGKVVVKF